MAIDLSTATGLLDRRSWPEARTLALNALAEDPRRVEAMRLLAVVSEAEGRLEDADRFLGEAVAAAPEDGSAVDELIRLSHRRGDFRRLGDALLVRLRISPGLPALWNDLGAALERLDDQSQATSCYRRAIAVDPIHAPALRNAAVVAYRLDRFAEALRLARRALVAETGSAQMLVVGGHAQQKLGDTAGAAASYRRALALTPTEGSAWEGLAATRRRAKADSDVLRYVRRTVSLAPFNPVALGNLCEALRSSAELSSAPGYGRQALTLDPGLGVAANALSVAFGDVVEDQLSTTWARRALHIDPADGERMINLGIALKAQGLFREAQRELRAGLERRPDDANGHMALATALLASGGVKEGLAEYEWRHASGFYDALPAPRWNGRPILTGALLVRGEQGVGDEIMFIQYISRLEGKVGKIVVECDGRLLSIFRRSYPGVEFVGRSTPPDRRLAAADIVAQISLMSLPHVLGFDISDLSSSSAYLVPDPGLRAKMAARLAVLGDRLRVGIAWRSRQQPPLSRRIHTKLSEWTPILRVGGVSFVNLQYSDVGAELAAVRDQLGIGIANLADLDLYEDLEGGLALGSCVDLVISTVTTSHCLAAAAGVEVWHLHAEIDYLGFGERRYIFCPRSRSFLRSASESWARPIREIADALRARVGSAGSRNGQ